MAEFASPQETKRALEILLDLQSKDPNKLDGILHKYANPFTSWPLLAEPTRTFLGFFEASAQTVETGGSQQNINPKLEEMVEEFTREFAAAKEQRVTASTASKNFIRAFLENARKSNVPLPEIQAPSVNEGAAPVPQERVQNIISAAVQHPGPPEEKLLVFHALTAFASEQPDKNIANLMPRAVDVARVAETLSSSAEAVSVEASFSAIAKTNFQRSMAVILDAVVPPAAKETIVGNILLGRLDTVVNHQEKLPRGFMEKAMNRWGEDFVNSSWFTRFRADANSMMTERAGALKIRSGFINFASDLATIIFRASPDENFLAYMEAHRFLGAGGVPAGNISFARNTLMGIGGHVVRAAIKYTPLGVFGGVRIKAPGAVGAGILRGMRIKAPGAVGAGILSGGILGRLLRANGGVFSPVINRGLNSLMGFLGRLRRVQTKINGWLIAGAVVFLFVLIILPIFGQSMIDTAIMENMGGGAGGDGSGGATTAGGPIGSVTLSCANTDGIYLSQNDPAWRNVTFPVSPCTISSDGCGPTSTTMILRAFGSSATVPDVAARVAAIDHFTSCSGSSIGANKSVLSEAGLSTLDIGTSWAEADNVLKNCGLLFVLGTAHHNGKDSGHYVVITGLNWNTDNTGVVSYNTLDPYWPLATQDGTTFTVKNMVGVVK